MPKLFALALLAVATGAAAAPRKDTNCMWVQAYTDTKLESCTLTKSGMLLTPARPTSRSAATDLLAAAAVATEMQKAPQASITVVRDAAGKSTTTVKGQPVLYVVDGQDAQALRSARKAFEKQVVHCEMKPNWEASCSDGTTLKLTPIS